MATDPTCPPVNTAPPRIAGPPIPSARLTCVPGTWRGANAFAYEWLRDGAQRATGVTYRPSTADIGHMLSCAVTATNADGSAQAASGAVRIIRDAPPLLYALRISPSAFRPARSGQSIVRFGRRGAIVSFRLDEPATVIFTLERAVHGSRINGRCRITAHTSARPCTIWRAVKGKLPRRRQTRAQPPALQRQDQSSRARARRLPPRPACPRPGGPGVRPGARPVLDEPLRITVAPY